MTKLQATTLGDRCGWQNGEVVLWSLCGDPNPRRRLMREAERWGGTHAVYGRPPQPLARHPRRTREKMCVCEQAGGSHRLTRC